MLFTGPTLMSKVKITNVICCCRGLSFCSFWQMFERLWKIVIFKLSNSVALRLCLCIVFSAIFFSFHFLVLLLTRSVVTLVQKEIVEETSFKQNFEVSCGFLWCYPIYVCSFILTKPWLFFDPNNIVWVFQWLSPFNQPISVSF